MGKEILCPPTPTADFHSKLYCIGAALPCWAEVPPIRPTASDDVSDTGGVTVAPTNAGTVIRKDNGHECGSRSQLQFRWG